MHMCSIARVLALRGMIIVRQHPTAARPGGSPSNIRCVAEQVCDAAVAPPRTYTGMHRDRESQGGKGAKGPSVTESTFVRSYN